MPPIRSLLAFPRRLLAGAVLGLASAFAAFAADFPKPVEADGILRDFHFNTGETLPELRIHYRTVGTPRRDAAGVVRNAVLIMHGTGGSGASLVAPDFAGELYGAGQALDATKYFIILPDAIGHGKSSKPSDGLHAKFPHYGYIDLVEANYRLLTETLGVAHARLIMGQSMGGMQTWLWGERHPEFMDALAPFASVPDQISGRNRVWRRVILDAIRYDPEWHDGEYKAQPPSLRTGLEMNWLMGSNPVLRWQEAPTVARADAAIDEYIASGWKTNDANDMLYSFDASRDYDPKPALEKIRAPLLAINSADDLINPPELPILEREIRRVAHGRYLVIPFSPQTKGHQSHRAPKLWEKEFAAFVSSTEPAAAATASGAAH